jgi:arylsulfatase A-like enzyme
MLDSALLLSMFAASVDAAERRPNVILLFPDQMRGQAMGIAGNDQVRTPHLDRLARGGLFLPNTLANTPVCCPARATMLTGKYPHKHGLKINDLRLRESQVTIAELLAEAGYATGFVGKWHLDGGIRQPGFIPPGPRRQGFAFWAANECSHRHFDTWYFRDDATKIPIKRFEADVWTDESIAFVRANRDKPFFLMVGMGPPHNPYRAPKKYSAMYDPAKLKMRPNWREGTQMGSRKDIAEYYAMITAVDDNVGRLIDVLDELKLADDTLILVTSDHGDMLGSQGMFLKRKPFEESIRIPGIVRYPRKLAAGQTKDTLFTHVDFAPTLLGFCGVKVPSDMQGRDLSKTLAGESTDEPVAAYLQNYMPYRQSKLGPWRGVRTKRHTYAEIDGKPWVLFDLREDPYELNNLVGQPEHAALQSRMASLLAAEMQAADDSLDHNIPEEIILYKRPAVYSVDELQ